MMKNPYKVMIISCWILLVLALIAKLLGANIFYPSTDNQTFINICNYLDKTLWLKYTIYCIISMVLNSLSVLAILGRKFYTPIQAIIFVPLIIAMSIVGWYNRIINIIIGVIVYVLPVVWLKKRWYRVLIGIGFILAFQIISIVTKNIGHWDLNNEYSLIAIIMQLDSIIMTMLYYLYSNQYELKRRQK